MNTLSITSWLSIVAIVMLAGVFVPVFTTVGEWPVAYFQLMNWAVMIAAVARTWEAHKMGNMMIGVVIFGVIAVLFNPVAPIYLSPTMWQMVDVVAGIFFIASFWFAKK
jgi:hypothetical protein